MQILLPEIIFLFVKFIPNMIRISQCCDLTYTAIAMETTNWLMNIII